MAYAYYASPPVLHPFVVPQPPALASTPAPDVWLQQWLQSSGITPPPSWTRSDVADRITRLGKLLTEAEMLVDGLDEEQATRVADEAEALIWSFASEAGVRQFAQKELKRQRKERWVVGKRTRKAENEKMAEKHAEVMEQLVDEWQVVSKNAEEEKARHKEETRRRVKGEAMRVEDERLREESKRRVAHLELLLALRAQRAGSSATHNADLRQYFDGLPRADTTASVTSPLKSLSILSGSRGRAVVPVAPMQHSAEYWESFYNAANQSAEALMEVRRAWDEHLTREGMHGTCIPPYWLSPPKPSSSWRSSLIYTNAANATNAIAPV